MTEKYHVQEESWIKVVCFHRRMMDYGFNMEFKKNFRDLCFTKKNVTTKFYRKYTEFFMTDGHL